MFEILKEFLFGTTGDRNQLNTVEERLQSAEALDEQFKYIGEGFRMDAKLLKNKHELYKHELSKLSHLTDKQIFEQVYKNKKDEEDALFNDVVKRIKAHPSMSEHFHKFLTKENRVYWNPKPSYGYDANLVSFQFRVEDLPCIEIVVNVADREPIESCKFSMKYKMANYKTMSDFECHDFSNCTDWLYVAASDSMASDSMASDSMASDSMASDAMAMAYQHYINQRDCVERYNETTQNASDDEKIKDILETPKLPLKRVRGSKASKKL